MTRGFNHKATVLVFATLFLLSTTNTHVTHSLYVDSEVVSPVSFVGNVTTTTAGNAANHTTTNVNGTPVGQTTVSSTTIETAETTPPPSTTTNETMRRRPRRKGPDHDTKNGDRKRWSPGITSP